MLDHWQGAKPAPFRGLLLAAVVITTAAAHFSVSGQEILRRPLGEGAHALLKQGRTLGVEVSPPDKNVQAFLQAYLALESEWIAYQNRGAAFIPYARLKPQVQRSILLAIFPEDIVDDQGWHHTVVDAQETLWSLCEWTTGRGANYQAVMTDPLNKLADLELELGQRIIVPARLLTSVMRRATPQDMPQLAATTPAAPKARAEEAPVKQAEVSQPEVTTRRSAQSAVAEADSAPAGNPFVVGVDHALEFKADRKGDYAVYRLKKGEALYTSVVARFTDYRENADILEACRIIAEQSDIRDVRDIHTGQTVLIPAFMLSDRYQPAGSVARKEYEKVIEEAERLAKVRPKARDLGGVVVILDPGHGGGDHGAAYPPLYEDEINYDIVCRIKRLLEATDARVYVTLRDKSTGYEVSDAALFSHDTDEELNTNPPYRIGEDSKVSLNLRWMLVNSIYARERAAGTDSRKIIFTSVHTDSLYNQSLRGAMVYIPGAKLRRGEERRGEAVYARYEEGRDFNVFRSSEADLLRDEALSRNFATVVLDQLGRQNIKRHDHSDPIRSQIRRSANSVWVPAVLRNNDVPTKILLETANLMNATDRSRLSDPWWRQQVAVAYVNALRAYFDSVTPTMTAAAGQ